MVLTILPLALRTLPNLFFWFLYLFGVFFRTSFNNCVISPMRICATSPTMAQLAESSFEDAMVERQRIDEFGRDIHQREWTRHYQYVEERDDEGDIIPDGVFSVSDDE